MTRIYLTRYDSLGFTKIAKLKYANLGEDWLDLELKILGKKISI